jgi:uncharacterized membrane protein YheB (UPF0754 family)
MNKSIITNLTALFIIILGIFSPVYSDEITLAGLFSLSGGVTNWLAIHMLFERVPFLYGSGVIIQRFNEFKHGIKELIMNQFFSNESIGANFNEKKFDKETILKKINYDEIFNKFVESIEESSMGSMLSMVGGKKALEPLKAPLKNKMRLIFDDLIEKNLIGDKSHDGIKFEIESLINKRLDELSPVDVKQIIKNIIHKHLGWLVVWGGIFGFLMGLSISMIG